MCAHVAALAVLIGLLVPASAHSAVVGKWSLNNTYGDSISSTATLAPAAAPNDPAFGAGIRGEGLAFDSNDVAETPAQAAHNLDVFTVEAWFRANPGTGTDSQIVSKQISGSNRNFLIVLDRNANTLSYSVSFSGIARNLSTSASTLTDGAWHHVAGVTSADGTLRFYVDGTLRASGNFPGNVDNPAVGIGLGYQLNGSVDEAVLHDTALSGTEIRESYESAFTGYSGTIFDPSGCVTGTTSATFATIVGGVPAFTSADCALRFGSTDDQASLRMRQSDRRGSALSRAADGALDSGFATGGILTEAGTDSGSQSVAVQEDGKVLLAGEMNDEWVVDHNQTNLWVYRYLENGTPDPSFGGGDGRVDYDPYDPAASNTGSQEGAEVIAVQPDGRILVGGGAWKEGSDVDSLIYRLLPDGTLDTTFGGDGKVFLERSTSGIDDDYVADLELLANGRILVASGAVPGGSGDDAALTMLNADGTVDSSYGSGGVARTDIDGGDIVEGLALQSDGKALIVTRSWQVGPRAYIARFTAGGSIDTTYGTNGKFALPWGGGSRVDEAFDVAVQSDNRAIVVGVTDQGTANHNAVISRVTTAGTNDGSFGTGGSWELALANSDEFRSVVVYPDDTIVASGFKDAGANDQVLLARTNKDGVADARFDSDGIVTHQVSANRDHATDLAMGPDGSLVTAGQHNDWLNGALKLRGYPVNDYSSSNNWSIGSSMFGACVRSASRTTTTAGFGWGVDGDGSCTASDADPWNAISASNSQVAMADSVGQNDSVTNLRFGLKPETLLAPGTYSAPLEIDVVAPNLYPPSNTTAPSIDDTTPTARQQLTASPGVWKGSPTIRYTYQWKRGGSDIAGATQRTYTVRHDDVGAALSVQVTATNSEGSATVTTGATSNVVAGTLPGAFCVTGWEAGMMTDGPNTEPCGGYVNVGTPSAVSTVKRTDNYALETSATDTNKESVIVWTSDATIETARFAFRIEEIPTVEQYIVQARNDDGWPIIAVTPTGTLRAFYNNDSTGPLGGCSCEIGTSATTANAIEPGRWYVLDMQVDTSTATTSLRWSVDGEAQTTVTRSGGNSGNVYFALGKNSYNGDFTAWFDDLAISTGQLGAYPIGPGAVHGLVPDGAATHSSPGTGPFGYSTDNGSGWTSLATETTPTVPGSAQRIDDWPVTTGVGADLVRQVDNTGAGHLQYDLEASPLAVDPNAVRLLGAHRQADASSASSVTVRANRAGSTSTAYTGSISAGTALEYYAGIAARPGGGAWTDDEITSMKVELDATDVDPDVWTDALLAEVDYPAEGLTNVTRPTISGTAKVNSQLTASGGVWSATPSSYDYRWLRCNASGRSCVPVGTNSSTYTPQAADRGNTIRVDVHARSLYGGQSARSATTALVAAQTPTLVYSTGFEHGTVGSSSQAQGTGGIVGGTPTVATGAYARTGRYALRSSGVTQSQQFQKSFTANADAVGRTSVMFGALPSTTITDVFSFLDTGSPGRSAAIGITNTGRLKARFYESSTGGCGCERGGVLGPEVTLGRWYVFDLKVSAAANTWTIDWGVDGVGQTSTSYNFGATSTFQSIQMGYNGNATMTVYHDDIAISTTSTDYPIGNGKVLGFTPESTGTHAETISNFGFSTNNAGSWTNLSSADNLLTPGSARHLDEWPTSSGTDADVIRQTATGTEYLEYNLTDTEETVAPNGVHLIAQTRDATGAAGADNNFRVITRLSSGGATTTPISGDPSLPVAGTHPHYMGGMMATRPIGGAWTAADFNALQLRVDSTNTAVNPMVDALLAEVDFPAESPPVATKRPAVTADTDWPREGSVLTVSNGSWSNGSTDYTYQWQGCDAAGTSCRDLDGSGTVGFWGFNGTLADSSPTGNAATLLASPNDPAYVEGAPGKRLALDFDNTDGAIIPYNAAYSNANNFTVDLWFNSKTLANGSVSWLPLINKETASTNRNFDVSYEKATGNLLFAASTGGVNKGINVPAASFIDGQWHHLAAVIDSSNTMHLYIDGVSRGTPLALGGPADVQASGIGVGTYATSGVGYFPGKIDEVRITRRAMGAAELRDYYLGQVDEYADESTYTLTASDVGKRIRAIVCARGPGGGQCETSLLGQTVANSQPTLEFLTGFESQTISSLGEGLFNDVYGTPTVDTAVKRSGTAAMRANATGSYSSVMRNLPAVSSVVMRFAFRMDSYPSDENAVMDLYLDRPGEYLTFWVNTSGQMRAMYWDNGMQHSVQSTALQLNQWYVIEGRFSTSSNNFTIDWSINGAPQTQMSFNETEGANTMSYMCLGVCADMTANWLIDDAAVSYTANDYPIGDGHVIGLKPSGAGLHNTLGVGNFFYSINNGGGWTAMDGETSPTVPGSAQYLDDWPVTTGGSADLVSFLPDTGTGHLQYDLADPPFTGTPNGVRVIGGFREAALGTNNATVRTVLGANTYAAVNGDPTGDATALRYLGGMSPRPGGGYWTNADLFGLKLEFDSTDAAPNVWADALMVEVDHRDT